MIALDRFSPATRRWFTNTFAKPTAVQDQGWGPIIDEDNTLLLAPTGSGKTLAAFLACLDRLFQLPVDAEPGVRVLYVSPLKALVYDIERNLRAPLVGIANAATLEGQSVRPIRVDIRTGDTSQRDRRLQAKNPADILVTTPESLYLILGSNARATLSSVQTVIIDEIHVMAGTKRGVHLALSLERLSAHATKDPQRIGLSATQRPLDEIARYLGGPRKVEVIDTSEPPNLSLEIVVPVVDMENPTSAELGPSGDGERQLVGGKKRSGEIGFAEDFGDKPGPKKKSHGMWPTIYPKLLQLIREHRTTIVFTNSRILCERLSQRLNEMAGEELVRAHHGSISHHQRAVIEEALKAGQLPAIVATSSLELGIDMGTVDLVVLVESPGSVARGLQRVGRAGHGVGQRSEGRIFPKFRGDLVEAAVVADHMRQGKIETTTVPRNCLDVLSQQIVAMCGVASWKVDELIALIRKAYPYNELTDGLFHSVLDMLSGRYPSDAFSELAPRINWDRTKDTLTARRGAKMLSLLNAGTIPDRGLYGVFLVGEGPRLGELDEEMVYESRKGDLIILGASTWRIEDITRDKVVVSPAPGQPGRLPFWHGEKPGRPIELGRSIGAFLRELSAQKPKKAAAWLRERAPLDELAAGNLLAYVAEQREHTGTLPTDRSITVEAFRDELGDWRVCILTPYGSRVHAPWGLALQSVLEQRAGYAVNALWTDDGIAIRFADVEELPSLDILMLDPEDIENLVVEQLRYSALFATRFRENAARALLLPRRRFDGRTPLWSQRLKAQNLMAVAGKYPAFPLILETYRECLQEVFDLPALTEILRGIRSREIQVHEVETPRPSPFARSLVFAYVAAFMYDGDAPLAERKAMALTLDRNLLRELLGQEELRELLDPDSVDAVEEELQWRTEDRRARHADGVHDLLRRLGDLSTDELVDRSREDPHPWLLSLESERRIVPIRIAGVERWIAAEDAGRYRDALGIPLPPGLPAAFLEPSEAPLEGLILRWARTHGPFLVGPVADRFGLPAGAVDAILRALEATDQVLRGDIRPGGTQTEWCHPEVLRRLRRRSLAALRSEVAPVESEVYARFLMDWHGIGGRRTSMNRLQEVLDQLEGVPVPYSMLETQILPARIPDFRPQMLDELGATGAVVWIGHGPLGPRDGKVALYRRERIPLLMLKSVIPKGMLDAELDPTAVLRSRIHQHLLDRGASFMVELQRAAGNPPTAEFNGALWDLAWAGIITNDTFQPLRGVNKKVRKNARRANWTAGGRWSLVADLIGDEVNETAQAHARAMLLLDRYGIASREGAKADGLQGGFSVVYPVLRAMEESGRARRGWFVEGLTGAQFALPGAVDRLRACRTPSNDVVVLAATDPANPWGNLLSWPDSVDDGKPRRIAGAKVICVGGAPVIYEQKGGKSLVTFPTREPEHLSLAIAALVADRGTGYRTIRVDKIDGVPANRSVHAPLFVAAGFAEDYKGLERVRQR